MNYLFQKAILKADELRIQLGLNIYQPVNIYDVCQHLNITVRFTDVNMEGLYIHNNGRRPTILLSNQRPFPRRIFTCAHELGHHVFEHGNKLDLLQNDYSKGRTYDKDELLVDSFAGALLMPIPGVQAEFIKRGWITAKATPLQFYIISSIFGTGYQTLVTHCKVNKLISTTLANALLKVGPSKIFKTLTQIETASYFKIIDDNSLINVTDLETSNYIILSPQTKIASENLAKVAETTIGSVYQAKKAGIIRVVNSENNSGYFVRIQNLNYQGLAEYRNLEN